MKSEFKRKLEQLLIADGISFESGIVEHITYLLAGMEVNETLLLLNNYRRFDFYEGGSANEDSTVFRVSSYSIPNLRKLLAFLRPLKRLIIHPGISSFLTNFCWKSLCHSLVRSMNV